MQAIYILRKGPWMDLLFWLLYGSFWHFVFSPNPMDMIDITFTSCFTFWQAVACYSHLSLLRKRWQEQISIPVYALGMVMVIISSAAGIWLMAKAVFSFFEHGHYLISSLSRNFLSYWVGAFLGGLGMAVAVTGAIYLFGRRREQEQQKEQLEHARTAAELLYLRGQLNPHFLFNALNSIYFLIPKKPELAAASLAGFSELLRYQLYRSETEQVPLQEELQQLSRFADLSKLRMEEDFQYQLDLPPIVEEIKIPPMLLLPLVENAFKYSPKQGGSVKGELKTCNGQLHFELHNKVDHLNPTIEPEEEIGQSGGIGLSNIKRRLAILYPGQHELVSQRVGQQFSIRLQIPLS